MGKKGGRSRREEEGREEQERGRREGGAGREEEGREEQERGKDVYMHSKTQ